MQKSLLEKLTQIASTSETSSLRGGSCCYMPCHSFPSWHNICFFLPAASAAAYALFCSFQIVFFSLSNRWAWIKCGSIQIFHMTPTPNKSLLKAFYTFSHITESLPLLDPACIVSVCGSVNKVQPDNPGLPKSSSHTWIKRMADYQVNEFSILIQGSM